MSIKTAKPTDQRIVLLTVVEGKTVGILQVVLWQLFAVDIDAGLAAEELYRWLHPKDVQDDTIPHVADLSKGEQLPDGNVGQNASDTVPVGVEQAITWGTKVQTIRTLGKTHRCNSPYRLMGLVVGREFADHRRWSPVSPVNDQVHREHLIECHCYHPAD